MSNVHLFRWAGSKLRMLDTLETYFRPCENYYEPFVGSATVYLNLAHRFCKKAYLSDSNRYLISALTQVKEDLVPIYLRLPSYERTEEVYKQIASTIHKVDNSEEIAAKFLYLQTYSFNGLWRMNLSGEYNVPWGKRPQVDPNYPDYMLAQPLFSKAKITHDSFLETLKHPKQNDFVYIDPPYLKDQDFSYTGNPFSYLEHSQLFNCVAKLTEKKVKVLISHSYNEFIINLYSSLGFFIKELEVRSSISATTKGRENRKELVIHNFNAI